MNSFVYFILDMIPPIYLLFFIAVVIVLAVIMIYILRINDDKIVTILIVVIVFPLIILLIINILTFYTSDQERNIKQLIQKNFSSEQQDFATSYYLDRLYTADRKVGFSLCIISNYGGRTCQAYLKENIERVKQKYADFMKEEYIKAQKEDEELRKIEEMKKIRQEEINKNIEKLGGV